MIYLRNVSLRANPPDGYPFLPLIRRAGEGPGMTLRAPVTVICGDNGSGKTTFAKLISEAFDCVAIGERRLCADAAALHAVVLTRAAAPKHRFYFSAEDFINYILDFERKRTEMREAVAAVEARTDLSATAKSLAVQPYRRELADMAGLYARHLASSSHGEGFLEFFQSRLRPDGFYVIDEPESALSFEKQFCLASLIVRLAREERCQFLIVTHSPVLAAIPDADLYEIRGDAFVPTPYEELENIRFLEMFFARRRHLFEQV